MSIEQDGQVETQTWYPVIVDAQTRLVLFTAEDIAANPELITSPEVRQRFVDEAIRQGGIEVIGPKK